MELGLKEVALMSQHTLVLRWFIHVTKSIIHSWCNLLCVYFCTIIKQQANNFTTNIAVSRHVKRCPLLFVPKVIETWGLLHQGLILYLTSSKIEGTACSSYTLRRPLSALYYTVVVVYGCYIYIIVIPYPWGLYGIYCLSRRAEPKAEGIKSHAARGGVV